jgi:hypothetical protein
LFPVVDLPGISRVMKGAVPELLTSVIPVVAAAQWSPFVLSRIRV